MAHQPKASSNLGSEPPRLVQAPSMPLSIVVFEAAKTKAGFVSRFYNEAGDANYEGISKSSIERRGAHFREKGWFGEISRLDAFGGGSEIQNYALGQDILRQALEVGERSHPKDLNPFFNCVSGVPNGEIAANIPAVDTQHKSLFYFN